MQVYLRGESLEAVARDTYGENWRAEAEATGVAAAVHCQAAHGSGWQAKFLAIWQGDG